MGIVVVSLMRWKDERDSLEEYLEIIQRELKHATRRQLSLPFIVVATHKDAFLQSCKKPNPREELTKAIDSLRKMANTDNVYPVTNYRDGSAWSPEVNDATFRMLRDVVTFAKNKAVNYSESRGGMLGRGLDIVVLVRDLTVEASARAGLDPSEKLRSLAT